MNIHQTHNLFLNFRAVFIKVNLYDSLGERAGVGAAFRKSCISREGSVKQVNKLGSPLVKDEVCL